jgi:uncharacterized protein
MRQLLIDKLCCPFDKQDLQLKIFVKDLEGNIKEGMLTCQQCKRYYPIVYGVPIMSPDEYREPQLETPLLQKWEDRFDGNVTEGFKLIANK